MYTMNLELGGPGVEKCITILNFKIPTLFAGACMREKMTSSVAHARDYGREHASCI